MYYTIEEMDRWAKSGGTGTANLTAVMADWLKLHAENERLHRKLAHACEAGKVLTAENKRLREAAEAVVEWWERGS